jgi:hypothetical protein
MEEFSLKHEVWSAVAEAIEMIAGAQDSRFKKR